MPDGDRDGDCGKRPSADDERVDGGQPAIGEPDDDAAGDKRPGDTGDGGGVGREGPALPMCPISSPTNAPSMVTVKKIIGAPSIN